MTLLGNPTEIMKIATQFNVSLSGAAIIDPAIAAIDDLQQALCKFHEERKAKGKGNGMTSEAATQLIRSDLNWFGTMMMFLGKVDGMVSGAMTTTADTLRPGLQVIKIVIKAVPGVSQVSSVFFMLMPDGVKVFADCALVIDPNAAQLANMAIASAQTARLFGVKPRIAMLSYMTGNDTHASTATTREATKLVKSLAPHELIEGPIQYDAAVDPRVAAIKFKGKEPSPVAGKASVFIFPELNAANITYKAVQNASKCLAIGPILQGFKKPINDLSRGCTVDDIVYTTVMTCIQAINTKSGHGNSSKL